MCLRRTSQLPGSRDNRIEVFERKRGTALIMFGSKTLPEMIIHDSFLTYYSFNYNLLRVHPDPCIKTSTFTYIVSTHQTWGREDGVDLLSVCTFFLGNRIHTHGLNHSSYADSQVFVSSPDLYLSSTPYLHPTAGYLPLDVYRALNSDLTLNSFVSCLNFLYCPDSPSLFMAPDPLDTQVRTILFFLPHSPSPMLATTSSNSTPSIPHRCASPSASPRETP